MLQQANPGEEALSLLQPWKSKSHTLLFGSVHVHANSGRLCIISTGQEQSASYSKESLLLSAKPKKILPTLAGHEESKYFSYLTSCKIMNLWTQLIDYQNYTKNGFSVLSMVLIV